MKKILPALALFLLTGITNAQIGFTWCESFDAPSLADSVTSYSSNPPANAGWTLNSRLQVSPANSDSAYVTTGDTVILSTIPIDFTGMTFVILEFDQICKVDFFDAAILQVSPDGGANWFQLTDSEYLTDDINPPGAPFGSQGNQFSAASYAIWQPANATAIPDNSWWQHEIFDLSAFAGSSANALVRFILYDANIPGGNGNNGWKIDNICITAAPCELTPPVIVQQPPILQNTVYNLGPFILNVNVTDNSGVDTVWMFYSINGVPDSCLMTNNFGNNFTCQIPAVSDSDTVCYYFIATDASACNNSTIYPASGCIQFVALSGITFPFCDNFDTQNLWTDSLGAGSSFQLGTPTTGNPGTPHSPPNVWDVALNSVYVDNTDCYLISPVFSFIGIVGAEISMWITYNTEQCCDWARVEYTLDGTTWNILDNPGNTLNWYNVFNGWGGAGTGWAQAKCLQPAALDNQSYVQFRMYFHSDVSIVSDGFAVDDFCVLPPAPFDAGIPQVVQPGAAAPAGSCLPVIVELKNFGLNTLTSFDVYYEVGASTFGPYPWTGNLAPGQIINDTLPCYTIPTGSFTICSWTSLASDGNHFNDTSCVNSVGIPVIPLSYSNNYCDDFEGPNIGWSVVNSGNPGTTWQLGTPNYGATTGAHSGVQAWDINLNTAYTDNADVALYSPIFDFATGPANDVNMSFWIRYNTETSFDGARLEYTTNGATWTLLGTLGSPNPPYVNWYTNTIFCSNNPSWAGSSSWVQARMMNLGSLVPTLNGQPVVQFRFTFCSDASVIFDGFSIDDFCLEVPIPLSATPTSVTNTTSGFPCIFEGQSVAYNTTIKNNGTTNISTLNATLTIDGSVFATEPITYSPALAPGASQSYTFTTAWTASPGTHAVCVITSDPNGLVDLNPADDTVCYNVQVCDTVGIAANGTYCNDFESGPSWATFNALTYSSSTSWQQGTPAQVIENAAHSGTQAWATGLSSNYPNRDSSGLFTPAFTIQANANYRLSFWHQYVTEIYQDGGVVEFSTDYGVSWTRLGDAGTAPDWYNTFFVTALGGNPPSPGWSGVTNAFELAQHEICFNGTSPVTVMFRFRFMSDLTVNDEGWVIDDVCFEGLGTACPVGIDEITAENNFLLGQNYPNPANGTTTIEYTIPEKGNVQLSIINLVGQVVDVVVDESQSEGKHYVTFDSNHLAPGIYYYQLIFNNEKLVKKMVVAN